MLVDTRGDICIRAGWIAPTWQASTAYALGDTVVPTADNTYYYECTTAGTSGVSEPTWPTRYGEVVMDDSVVWTRQGTSALFKGFNRIAL